VPTVAVLSANALYGALVESVTFGFVSPEKDARTFVPHVSVESISRTALVEADPPVDHASCRLQLVVKVQSVVWLSGPCSVNIPTVKLNFGTSAPGEWLQQSV
jgi:hypothetical protein